MAFSMSSCEIFKFAAFALMPRTTRHLHFKELIIMNKKIKVGIGFATGRKTFLKVLRSYIHNWEESGLVDDANISLNLFVAYDLSYNKTARKDYTNIHPELFKRIDSAKFISKYSTCKDIDNLCDEGVISREDAKLIFSKGYASQRNAIIYNAVKHGMDYLIFLDDDEYPVAVTNTRNHTIWSGQHVLDVHIENLKKADITHGYHCGYISPIPYIKYNEILREEDFKEFITAISNDILSWEKISEVAKNGGVTYGDIGVLINKEVRQVEKINSAKFISGANLGINLSNPARLYPFYNPRGARGEDTFLSTCITDRKVLKVPCYTFHDGFSTYHHLLEGVLPINLKFISADNEQIINRFYKACIGWIRYKPLLLYITQRESYDYDITQIRRKLTNVLPKICDYFNKPDFANILTEFDKYDENVVKHFEEYNMSKKVWKKIMRYLDSDKYVHYLYKPTKEAAIPF